MSTQDVTKTQDTVTTCHTEPLVPEDKPVEPVQSSNETSARQEMTSRDTGPSETTSREFRATDAASPADVSLLSALLAASQRQLEAVEASASNVSVQTCRSMKKVAATLETFRDEKRLTADLQGYASLLPELNDLATEIELTLWDAIDAAVQALEDLSLSDLDEQITALHLLTTAGETLKRDARKEAERMRLLSQEDDWTDAELAFFASQTSVREKYREKRAKTQWQSAIQASRRARKEARRQSRPRSARQQACDEKNRVKKQEQERTLESSFGVLARKGSPR